MATVRTAAATDGAACPGSRTSVVTAATDPLGASAKPNSNPRIVFFVTKSTFDR